MKNAKNWKALLLVVLMLSAVLLFAACGGEASEGPAEEETAAAGDSYQVTVVDAKGNPYTSGVIVRYMQNGQQIAMQVVDDNGVATKELEDGDYDIELQFTDDETEFFYETAGLKLTKDSKSLEVVVSKKPSGQTQVLYAYSLLSDGKKDFDAYVLDLGCTYVDLIPGERNYFLFAPQEAGTYEISVVGADAAVGYYGAHHFVQDFCVADVVDNVITMSVSADMIGDGSGGSSIFVYGLDAAEGVTSGILSIQRTGDPAWTYHDEPWNVYTAKTAPTPYTLELGDGQQLKKVDITGATEDYPIVLNEADGYYHLGTADGPVMLVQLCPGVDGPPSYICFETMVGDGTTDKGVTALRRYFFDENDEFISKEDYTECMISYNVCADETYGVYPLTEDLVYMIQNGGEQQGWWDPEGPGYLFIDDNYNALPGINNEISWMFACCYVEITAE